MVKYLFKKPPRNFYLLGILVVVILTTVVTVQIPMVNNSNAAENIAAPLGTSASTNPASPVLLYDDSSDSETWSIGNQHYYYRTYSLSTSDYHLIWLQFQLSSYDMDLYLYSDSAYTNQIAYSARGATEEWLIYNPSSSGYVYPTAYTDSITGNTGYIEAESAYDITIGGSFSFSLGSTDAGSLVETFLSNTQTYTIKLTVPTGADYDLYVCRIADGSCTEQDLYSDTSASSTRSITFTPLYSDTYAIAVIRRSGSGYATLSVRIFQPIPGFEMFWILIGTISALGMTLFWFKKRESFTF